MNMRCQSSSKHFPLFHFEVEHLMPLGWQGEILDCATRGSRWAVLDGRSSTSRESKYDESATARVGVVRGDLAEAEVPWLVKLYREEFLDLANNLGRPRYQCSPDPRSAVNINIIRPGDRYEWHVDSNPLTGVLFVTTHSEEDGGLLLFRPDDPNPEAWEARVTPKAGTLVLFDARCAAHTVTSLRGTQVRVSVPMNFYFADVPVERPEDLDDYLYE